MANFTVLFSSQCGDGIPGAFFKQFHSENFQKIHFQMFMFQSISGIISDYYNVTDNQVIWLAQVSLVTLCLVLFPCAFLSDAVSVRLVIIGPDLNRQAVNFQFKRSNDPCFRKLSNYSYRFYYKNRCF